MWPGPYGQGGGSRKYVLASLDQSLARLGLDYVDIFYSHRFDPQTPVEETMMAPRPGGPLRARPMSASRRTRRGRLRRRRRSPATSALPCSSTSPSYSLLNRWVEGGLLAELDAQGMGCIAFTALAQGLLTNRYLTGIPAGQSRAREGSTVAHTVTDAALARVRGLAAIAEGRGDRPWPRWFWPGCCGAIRGSPRWSWGEQCRAARRQPRRLGRYDVHRRRARRDRRVRRRPGVDLWADCVAD